MDIGIAILTWTMWVLLTVLGLLLLLVHLPYRARITADWDESHLDVRAWVGWPLRLLGGLVTASFEQQQVGFYFLGLRLKSWSFGELKKKREKKPKAQKKDKKKHKKKKMFSDSGEWGHMMRMPNKRHALKRIYGWLFMNGTLEGRFGFDDPYTTGQIALVLTLVRTVFPSIGRQVELDYLEPACEGRLDMSMMIWLPRIEVGIIAFLLSRQGRDMLRHYLDRPKAARTAA